MNNKDTQLKKKFIKKFVFESKDFGWIIERDHAEDVWDFIHSAVNEAKKEERKQLEREIKGMNKGEVPFFPHEMEYGLTDAWQEGFNQALQDVLDLLKKETK